MDRMTIQEIIDHCTRKMAHEPTGSIFYREHEAVKAYLEELQQYRSTSLTPEDFGALSRAIPNEQAPTRESIRRLIRDGRLVVLPCKVGDILYYFPEWYARSGYEPTPISVEEVNSFSGNVVVECYMDHDTRVTFLPADFGKTIFLTLEEAKAALVMPEPAKEDTL